MCFKTLVDEVQELEALSKDPGAVVHGKRYSYKHCNSIFVCLSAHRGFIFSLKGKVVLQILLKQACVSEKVTDHTF